MDEAEVSVKTEPSQECDSEPLKEEPEIAKEKDSASDDKAGANSDLAVGKTEDAEPEDRDRGVKRRSDHLRAVFVGNFPPMFTADDIEGLFVKHGEVRRVDKKQNFAFVFMARTEDAEVAIGQLGGKSIGRPPRTLRVEWSRGDGAVRRREVARRSRSLPPNETLFVVNYDPESVVQKDLEDLFKVHGRIVRIELHGQFTFVQYETIDMAAKALECLNGFNFKNRNLIVEFTIRKDSSGGGRVRYPNQRMNDHGPRGYGSRAPYGSQYPPMGNMGGYGGHAGPGNFGGGYRGNHGPPPYGMNHYQHSHGFRGNDSYGRFDDRGRYGDGRQSVPRPSGRRDDGYGWSAALSDRRNKRSYSPRSMSPRRGDMPLPVRKERGRSRSASRSASPGRSRGRNRRSMSRSASPKKRRSHSPDGKVGRGRSRSRSRSPVARSRSRSMSRSRSRSGSPSRMRAAKGSPAYGSPRSNSSNHERRKRSRSGSPANDIADSPQKRAKLDVPPSAVTSSP